MDSDRGPIRQVDGRSPFDDPRTNAYEDMDLEDSRTDTTRRTPRASETT